MKVNLVLDCETLKTLLYAAFVFGLIKWVSDEWNECLRKECNSQKTLVIQGNKTIDASSDEIISR